MCLWAVDKKTKFQKRRIGYKVMRVGEDGSLTGLHYGGSKKVGESYVDTSSEILPSMEAISYLSGYHILLNKSDALRKQRQMPSFSRVVRVRFSDVVASGKEWGETVVVARQMTILEILN